MPVMRGAACYPPPWDPGNARGQSHRFPPLLSHDDVGSHRQDGAQSGPATAAERRLTVRRDIFWLCLS